MLAHRTLLRLAMTAAIAGYWRAPSPTLAGLHVYDSRLENIEDRIDNPDASDEFPVVIVYSDYDRHFLGKQVPRPDGAATYRLLTMTIEIMVVIRRAGVAGKKFELDYPATDTELEMSLDCLEQQVFQSLEADNAAADLCRFLMHGVEDVVSRRGADSKNAKRLAARQITIELRVPRDPRRVEGQPLASEIEAFLASLDGSPQLGDRVETIREMMKPSASRQEARMREWRLPDRLSSHLGLERGPAVVLPDNIQWLDPATGGALR